MSDVYYKVSSTRQSTTMYVLHWRVQRVLTLRVTRSEMFVTRRTFSKLLIRFESRFVAGKTRAKLSPLSSSRAAFV